MPSTYDKITSTTFSASSSVNFTSIPSTYTDLRIVFSAVGSTTNFVRVSFNNVNTGTAYSRVRLFGDGTNAQADQATGSPYMSPFYSSLSTTIPELYIHDIFSYAGSTSKSMLTQVSADLNGSGGVARIISLWSSTAAITSVQLYPSSGTITGTATLYGIVKA